MAHNLVRFSLNLVRLGLPENGVDHVRPDCRLWIFVIPFQLGWLAHPIFKGDYPPVMREYLDRKSIAEGRTQSRLPTLDTEWVRKLKGMGPEA